MFAAVLMFRFCPGEAVVNSKQTGTTWSVSLELPCSCVAWCGGVILGHDLVPLVALGWA